MTVEQLFEEAKQGKYEGGVTKFWENIAKSITTEMPFNGISTEEIKAYLKMKGTQYECCACGNQSFNCICYSDAE